MEKSIDARLPESRQLKLKKSFKQGINALLTSCSKEEVCKAFGRLTNPEQEVLHRLLIEVISSLHANIQEELESICLENQTDNILEFVEQLVEEQSLDPLFSYKTNVGDVWQDLSTMKKNEIQHLMNVIQTEKEREHAARARVEKLKKEAQIYSGTADVIEKMRTGA